MVQEIITTWFYMLALFLTIGCHAWLPDTTSKLIIKQEEKNRLKFLGNASAPDHFTILYNDDRTLLLGARNAIYNLSINDLYERSNKRILWPSKDHHRQLCELKGKNDNDCQNYIRVLFFLDPEKIQICGTNSFKPLCKHYSLKNDSFIPNSGDLDATGICPYDAEHNSTALYSNGQLFTATFADFQGGDPLIFKNPQRTDKSNLKQLNAPNFVSSVPYGDYIFFFYRETAVEYINCGKMVYSRVARICKDDKGGPHQFGDRWTSFLKARLNCSVPGEYPFYFDEIQSTTDIVDGQYGNRRNQLIYGTLTTPTNAIGGSAICAYSLKDIMDAFEGSFKDQESINSNWLPIPNNKVPQPRPGQCVKDSRTLPDVTVNFVKTHSLMENAVPAYFGQPLLIRVSLQYRFTAIVVEAQVSSGDETYDILYVGTDDGQVLKVVNIASTNSTKAVVISETRVLPAGVPVKEMRMVPGEQGQVVVMGREEVHLVNLIHCNNVTTCASCLNLQDPHCGWDQKSGRCVHSDGRPSILQEVESGSSGRCQNAKNPKVTVPQSSDFGENAIRVEQVLGSRGGPSLPLDGGERPVEQREGGGGCVEGVGCGVRLVIYTAETLHIVVIGASIAGLALGFVAGYLFSRRFQTQPTYQDAPFIEQHNHLERRGSPPAFLTPRANKAINLVVNMPSPTTPKKDNLVNTKDLNITNEGTLQKIKKTYI